MRYVAWTALRGRHLRELHVLLQRTLRTGVHALKVRVVSPDRLGRLDPGQELAGHHPREADQADDHHEVHRREQRGPVGLADHVLRGAAGGMQVEERGPDLSRVRFVQAYESDSYSDVVRKVIDLERGIDGWLILRESVEP